MQTIDQMLLPHVGWLAFEAGDDVATFLRQGWFEAPEQAMLWLYGRPGDTVLDIGAHVGLFSAIAQQAVMPGGRVIAVEPSATTAELLRRNTGGQTTVLEAAVGQITGRQVLHSEGSGKSAYNTLGGDAADGVEVDVVTIDQLMTDQGVARADFVKLDVEGAELAAWRGAKQAIEQQRLGVVMIEFTEPNLKRAGTSSRELFAAVNDSGYTLCRFDTDALQLVAAAFDQPIWYDNLFATADVDAANARLRDAPDDRRRIAADVLARGAAGSVSREVLSLQRRVADLEHERDETVAALEKVRGDLNTQIELRDRSYEAHQRTRDELIQTQTWLRTTTQSLRNTEAQSAERIAALEEKLQQTREKLQQRERQLLELCTSRYEQLAWRVGLRKKPDWVDPFLAEHQPTS